MNLRPRLTFGINGPAARDERRLRRFPQFVQDLLQKRVRPAHVRAALGLIGSRCPIARRGRVERRISEILHRFLINGWICVADMPQIDPDRGRHSRRFAGRGTETRRRAPPFTGGRHPAADPARAVRERRGGEGRSRPLDRGPSLGRRAVPDDRPRVGPGEEIGSQDWPRMADHGFRPFRARRRDRVRFDRHRHRAGRWLRACLICTRIDRPPIHDSRPIGERSYRRLASI